MIANRLTLHSNKTLTSNVSSFFRIRTAPKLSLTRDNVKIKNPLVVKYLGVLLDNNLSFKPQIAHFESKLSQSVGVITVSILVVLKANSFYARGSVIAFKIAPPRRGSDSYNFKHSKQYKSCKILTWIFTVK